MIAKHKKKKINSKINLITHLILTINQNNKLLGTFCSPKKIINKVCKLITLGKKKKNDYWYLQVVGKGSFSLPLPCGDKGINSYQSTIFYDSH